MKSRVLAQTKPPATSVAPTRSNFLQRKCACGGTPGPTGECEECSKKKRFRLQTKLKISEPGDVYEQEADLVADQVMEPTHSGVSDAPPRIQHFSGQSNGRMVSAPASVDQALASPGRPLEPALRRDMEQRFGHDFSSVRVHSDAAAAESARQVNAQAYTVGHKILFAAGRFAPATLAGYRLLAHELTHVIQQAGDDHKAPGVVNSPSPEVNLFIQRRETGAGLEDPLYMADRRWSAGQGPDDRVTGQRLQNWAIARGSFVVRSEEALKRMQEKDGAESEIADDILVLLVDLLEGRDPRSPYDTSAIFVGTGPRFRIESERTRLDKFEGSENAREMAVIELEDHWGSLERYFTRELIGLYRNSYLEAAGRTPKDMSLEDDTEVIKRIRTHPYGHEHRILQGLAGDVVFKVDRRYGSWHIVDIYNLGSGPEGGGTVWIYLDGYPLWYYSGSVDLLNRQTVVGEVARGVAEAAKFAGQLFPLLIKAGGFALSFSPSPLMMIAGVVLDELGEEGLRDLSGEGRSFKDIASSAGREILVNLVLGRLMGGGGEGKPASEAAEALDKVAEKAAVQVRVSVEKEIARTEGPQLVKAVEAGEVRGVTDKTLVDEGFVYEMHIKHEGGSHIYRRKLDGEVCRWSTHRICGLEAIKDEIKEIGGFQEGFEGPLGDIVADPKEAGNLFNRLSVPEGAHAEIQLRTPSGRRPRVDLYVKGEKIISRKFPMGQLANDDLKALDYLQELYVKYPPKAPIRSAALRGEVLEGIQVLQVPVQYVLPLPEIVLKYARDRNIIICDIEGKIYNL